MVLARADNIKSGWKSMFMVFTTAAGDPGAGRRSAYCVLGVGSGVSGHVRHAAPLLAGVAVLSAGAACCSEPIRALSPQPAPRLSQPATRPNPQPPTLDPTIVRLAFDTIERIVREHFGHITETEAATFTDAVNCLIAFTNNPHSLEVALSAIAFLRFCAMRLAEGLPPASDPPSLAARGQSAAPGLPAAAGASFPGGLPMSLLGPGSTQLSSSSAGEGREAPPESTVYYWFPLLAGLSELTFDPRGEIRYSALEVGGLEAWPGAAGLARAWDRHKGSRAGRGAAAVMKV
jgi:hypothetical protein